jgi:hypothetical protein
MRVWATSGTGGFGPKIARPPVDVAEVTRLNGLRMWVEQSYKQVK